ncbi:sugar ABC transporter substrate-binding protein [Paenibacillus radicis (ex Xue et al. 2023)]|uniref:Sugar ABC transporter substrate-binding protein n=1 Tax=Paenibacillus radicis (ex Xue et al. 2023) TaxID=2972489 RepID=A0ABT1YPZ0_9BACL|nr:sugar ABC transporter substrate-binding protein [Paenibacillus radicis (ex Xue et al. 2023)]MCR8634805.1 sugar ABC transporter substrate-binding protein [Paenibacillus radicis (ex Xue et al. 2023)]
MFKNVRALMMAMVTVPVLLTACAPSGEAPKSAQGSTASGDKVTIQWWDSMTSEATQGALKKTIAEYETAHPNVKIERTFVSFADIKNKLLLGAAGNQVPDIVWIDNPDHQAFAAAGILADITKEIQQWGQADKYFSGPWSSTMYKGKNYGVPIGSNDLALYYNVDMLKEAGINPPKTWDELKDAAQKLTKPDVYGFSMTAVKTEEGTFQFLPLMYQAGSDISNFNSAGTVEAATLLKDMVSKGYMSKEVINQKQSDTVVQFSTGKVAMMVNGTWQIPLLRKEGKVNWDVVQLPTNKQGGTILGGENWAITDASKHKDIAFDIIKFANEPDRLKEFLKAAGRLPSREDYLMDPFWQNDKQLKVFADAMKVAKARAYGPNYPKISDAIQIMMQEVITGAKAPDVAVKDADAKIKPLLQQ